MQGGDVMAMNFDNERPIYLQIVEKIKIDIVTGAYSQGMKLPSIRDMAKEYQVNPNTMQRAFIELEESGLVYTERGNGRFVNDEKKKILEVKAQIADTRINEFMTYMQSLDLSNEEIINLINKKGD